MSGASPLYPVTLRLEDMPCLVVGGGPVAARKVAGLLASGASVTVVAPSIVAAIEEAPVTVHRRPYESGEAAGFRFVIAATGIALVDRAVAADADAAGIFVNCADDAEHCSALLPAVHRDGAVSLAVSTDGSSPALASWLRERMAQAAGPGLGVLAALLAESRREVRESGRSTEGVDWRTLLDGPLIRLVREGDLDGARALLAEGTKAGPPASA